MGNASYHTNRTPGTSSNPAIIDAPKDNEEVKLDSKGNIVLPTSKLAYDLDIYDDELRSIDSKMNQQVDDTIQSKPSVSKQANIDAKPPKQIKKKTNGTSKTS